MRSALAAAALICLSTAAFAQGTAQPTMTGKAMDAVGSIAGKVMGTTPAAAPAATTAKAPLININKATAAELDGLPQIGEARSKAIIAARPYKTAHELVDKKVIPAGVYDVIKDKIAVK